MIKILEVIRNRWSPLVFSGQPVEQEKVMMILEAARWAPSSFNEQPWSYIVGYHGDEIFQRLSECLNEGNAWAKNAGVLMLSVAKLFFSRNHKPNRHAMHDVGAASVSLAFQATALGLVSHQMAGWNMEKARAFFNIGPDYEPGSMIAIGYSDETRKASRARKSLDDMIWKV